MAVTTYASVKSVTCAVTLAWEDGSTRTVCGPLTELQLVEDSFVSDHVFAQFTVRLALQHLKELVQRVCAGSDSNAQPPIRKIIIEESNNGT